MKGVRDDGSGEELKPSAKKERGRRTPRTVKNSRFSIYSRYRVRYALASYRHRYGMSFETVLKELYRLLGPEKGAAIPDKQSVKEFLNGSEPNDDKIEVFLEYQRFVDPDLIAGFDDDGFNQLTGDVFTQLFLPFPKKVDYHRALRNQNASALAGLYVRFFFYDVHVGTNAFLMLLRAIENSPFLLCDTFQLNVPVRFEKSQCRPETLKFFDAIEDGSIDRESYAEGMTVMIEDELRQLEAKCAPHPPDIADMVRQLEKGMLFADGNHGFFFLRDPLRYSPTFETFTILQRRIIKRGDQPSTSAGRGQYPRDYYKIRSKLVEYYVNKIPWVL